MDENDIIMTEAEECALRLMEQGAEQTDGGTSDDGGTECADDAALLMLMQTAMLTGANPDGIDAGAELSHFHASHRKARIWRMGIMMAAAAALLLTVLVPIVLRESGESSDTPVDESRMLYKASTEKPNDEAKDISEGKNTDWQVAATRHGSTKTVVLSDGTEVMLSTNSRLSYPAAFTGATRTVTLTGEAYFRVAKDRRHPFIVRSGGIETKVLGTEFDVRSYNEERPQVILVEGKVALSGADGARRIEMHPGQSAVWNGADDFTVSDNADTQTVLSWKDGYLYFDDVTFGDMMREIGRWYNIDVTAAPSDGTETAMQTRVHFYIPVSQQLNKTIDMLDKQGIAAVSLTGSGIVVSGKQ